MAAKEDLLPVSLLCGFLGAGKTTLLKHVLETKHEEDGFKCAVIVNDMATLNIDKSLIDKSALIQSDEVIAMQNGCICCNLQGDFVAQIIELAQRKVFNYMLIEASGVSEPSEIAPLFNPCDEEHDHVKEHKEGQQLAEFARLDTCVTVIDAAEFYSNLEGMKLCEEGGAFKGTIADLMMEQVEYSNVVVLNKVDLVSEGQQNEIMDKISLLNPRIQVLKSCHGKINVMEILNTRLYSRVEIEEGSVIISAMRVKAGEMLKTEVKSCCKKSLADGRSRCCKSKAKNGMLVDSGLSQVLLGVVQKTSTRKMTRHKSRFGITSFLYRARRPFHPGRLVDYFLEPFFVEIQEDQDLVKQQKEAAIKKPKRVELMGELLRSKGFMWIASSNSVMGGFQQAGNIVVVSSEGPWMCELREMWEGTALGALVLKDMNKENGEEWPYADRRQELVFIGHNLKHAAIQRTLDQCLLNDEEMRMGPDKWEESMASCDKIQLSLDESDFEGVEDEETSKMEEM